MKDVLGGFLVAFSHGDYPTYTTGPEPEWHVLAMGNPRAPVVTMTPDPRAGDRLAEVFFVTTADQSALDDLATRIYRLTDGAAAFRITSVTHRHVHFLVIPQMIHLHGRDEFIRLMTKGLEEEETRQTIAWCNRPFVIRIDDHGTRHSLVAGADGEPVLVSEPSATTSLSVEIHGVPPRREAGKG